YVFWIGDLNFRTDHPTGSSPTSEEIVATLQKVEKDKYNALLKHDQLKAVMETGEAFSEFSEPEIRRKPSWTDRVLYKVIVDNYENIKLRADLISYNHISHYTVSDHKPVVAQFNIKESPRGARSTVRMRSALIAPADVPDSAIPTLHEQMSTYEYLAKVSLPEAPAASGQPRAITLSFPVGSGVRTPGFYRLIYFSQPNNDVRSVLEYLAKVSVPEAAVASGQPRAITLSF
ncbi:putative skeletal muscle/kidney enriched inositol 5-phosphatase, partial [Operophtera brumata]